ncbi:exonuclease SbcD [Deinobacterium chartae]|uniref:Nuclease SbcCD subunit D n=1 Tax=Deinobacterium chartae TaxID=521158 RepID=A0A841I2F3_9DEIO|nr:exonuclease SbcCD subunit D [Deinobacterium chartae]MBB6099246.1 exonuclease SbcD [Deinobacterium chartae]
MRILHTADFHAGRVLRGFDRTPEIRAALLEVAELARSERVDAVLVAGDLFDSVNPSADAEAAIFEFFLALKERGLPSVVIAGNHDSASRLASVTGLLNWVGAQVVAGMPANPLEAVRTLQTRSGEELVVAAFPFLSERRLVKYADVVGGDVSAWRERFQQGMGFFIDYLTRGFKPSAVNTLMLHTTVSGSKPSGSERAFTFDITNSYTVSPQMLPTSAQYVALGHIHKAQQVADLPLAHYAGSLIQLDFGESRENKMVKLIEAQPGRPARVHDLPISGGRELRTVRTDVEGLERRLEELRSFGGLLKVVVEVPAGFPMPGLKDRVLAVLPNTLSVELEKVGETETVTAAREGLSPLELFERYYRERRGELPEAVRAAFLEADRAVREAAGENV